MCYLPVATYNFLVGAWQIIYCFGFFFGGRGVVVVFIIVIIVEKLKVNTDSVSYFNEIFHRLMVR